MAEWKRVKLGEVADLALGKMLDAKKNRGEPYRYLNNVAVRWGSFDLAELPEMRFEQDEIERYLIRENDIVICEGGEPGRCAIWNNGEPIFYQKALHRARVKEFACPRYVYYSFTNLVISGATKQFETGSTIRHLPAQNLKEIEIPLPPLSTQRKIAAVLGALDDKIENNRKICANLEAQAQALFKSWFVDFEPFGGKMPSGWKMGRLGDVADTVLGGTPSRDDKTLWGGDIAWINSGKVNDFRIIDASEYITQKGLENSAAKLMPAKTVVLAITGATLGQVSILEIESAANQSVIGILENDRIPYEFIYPLVVNKIQDLMNCQTGGAQQHINKNDVNNLQFILPDITSMREYSRLARTYYDCIASACFESRALAAMRDALLPKLMSGEIDVEKVEV